MSGKKRFDDAVLERIREENKLSDILEGFGVKLRRAGREYVGLSPFNHEKSPSFTVNDEKGFFHCFSSGNHGDVIDAVMHFTGRSFVDAVEWFDVPQEITDEDRNRIEKKKTDRAEQERVEREKTGARVARAFDEAAPIEGTAGASYLERRGLPADPSWTFDLRFAPSLLYRGFANEASDETSELGVFPAMVAAIRGVDGRLIGLHRTYIGEDFKKLTPPGDARRNRAKKILGETSGGMIRLSEMRPRIAMGEGIETTRAWFLLADRGETAIAAAVSLGNLAGSATGSIRHPRHAGKYVPNGVPDLDRPGVILPRDVEEVILLGDGDSDPEMTRQRLRVAGARFKAQRRDVFVSMAPRGADWNDVLQQRGQQ